MQIAARHSGILVSVVLRCSLQSDRRQFVGIVVGIVGDAIVGGFSQQAARRIAAVAVSDSSGGGACLTVARDVSHYSCFDIILFSPVERIFVFFASPPRSIYSDHFGSVFRNRAFPVSDKSER